MSTVMMKDIDTEHAQADVQPIVFFDGVCGLCNRLVNITLRMDRNKAIKFAPLQGETAQRMLPPLAEDALDWSMIYWDGERAYSETDASIELCRKLGGVLTLVTLCRWVPRWIRNPMYRMVARMRYRLFGKLESCRVPSEEERARFLP